MYSHITAPQNQLEIGAELGCNEFSFCVQAPVADALGCHQ